MIERVKCLILSSETEKKFVQVDILYLSHDVTSGSSITTCNKIDKPLVVDLLMLHNKE